jgi:hypothetical protein
MSVTSIVNDTIGRDSFVNSQKPVPPTINGYSVSGLDDTALDPAGGQTVFINGTGFQRGAIVTFDGSAIAVVSFVSSSRLSFTSPAKSAGTYTIYVVNSDGGTAIFIPGIIYSTLPTWTTAAGSLGSYFETTSISNTVSASGDVPITYSLFSGVLPPGSTLNANGVLSGTSPVDSGSTTYSFTIEAIDNQLQGSTRSFSLTINTDVVSWVSPTQGQTLTFPVNTAISNVALNATSAAGYNVSYLANSLPTGLSLTGNTISGTPTVIANTSTLLTATAATTNRSATNTITWAVIVASDPQIMYVTTLLSPQISVVPFNDDASTNNFPISVVGDTRPNNFGPYTPGYYSNFFDGTGDSLVTPTSENVTMGSGNFTIELWAYPTVSPGTWTTLLSIGVSTIAGREIRISQGQFTYNTLGVLYPNAAGNGDIFAENTGYTLPLNRWTHIALVRSGSNMFLFAAGTLIYTYSVSFNQATNAFVNIANNPNNDLRFTGNISNIRIVKGTAVYTSAFTPPTEPLTAIAGTSLLTCQSNRFIDNSTNNFAITRNGDVRIDGFDPFVIPSSISVPNLYSVSFDGTGDVLTVPNNAAFNISANFTIEMWIYPTALSGIKGLFGQRALESNYCPILLEFNGATLQFFVSTSGSSWAVNLTSPSLTVNTWTHIALVRSGNTVSYYINGVVGGSTGTATGALMTPVAPTYIGADAGTPSGAGYFPGYISNFRIVNGTALYTANFTPPTQPLTAISGTSLLTCQNSTLVDNSTNNFAITSFGQAQPIAVTPFTQTFTSQSIAGSGSTFFDGNGDQLTVPANAALQLTGDFTVEAWIYPTVINSFNMICGVENGGNSDYLTIRASSIEIALSNTTYPGWTQTFVANQWYHIAVTRSSNTLRAFVNGVQLTLATGSATSSLQYFQSNVPFAIGKYASSPTPPHFFTGYISNLRIVKGTALYTSNFTSPQAPLTAVTNTSLLTCQTNQPDTNSMFLDSSTSNFLVTRFGNTTQGTFSPYGGGWSNFFDGTGDYLSIPDSSQFSLGSSNFTMEAWIYPTATGNFPVIAAQYQTSSMAFFWSMGPTANPRDVNFYVYYSGGNTLLSASNVVVLNTWAHHAVVRNSNTLTYYINGVSVATAALSNAVSDASAFFTIGSSGDTNYTIYPFTGYISNYRLVIGTAVYTANFTPPTAPLQPITGTSLLTCADNRFVDDSPNNFVITRNGDVSVQKFNPFGIQTAMTPLSHSAFFDGSGDFLDLPNNTVFSQTGSWTLELWVYSTAATNNYVYSQNTTNFLQINISASNFVQIDRSGVGNLIVSTNPITLNIWTHIALVSDGTNMRLFINGTQSGSTAAVGAQAASATTTRIGAYQGNGTLAFQGYISNLRLVKGTALYTANFTPSTTPLTAIAGTGLLTCQNPTFVDNSTNRFTITAVGNTQPVPVNPFGFTAGTRTNYTPQVFGGSMSFDGTGDYVQLPWNTPFALGGGNFTIECWVYPTTSGVATGLISNWQTGGQFILRKNASNRPVLVFTAGSAVTLTGTTTTIVTGMWNHVAAARNGSMFTLYVNGVADATTATNASAITGTGIVMRVGADGDASSLFTGFISDARIIPGTALYTSNFVPPTAPVVPVTNTTLLVNGTGAAIYDASTLNNLETVGNAKSEQFGPYNAGYYSNFFDGTGDFLTVPSNAAFNITSGSTDSFICELWVNFSTVGANMSIIDNGGLNGVSFANWTIFLNASNQISMGWANSAAPGSPIGTLPSTIVPVVGRWYHIALVKTNADWSLFIDGTRATTFNGLNTAAKSSTTALYIGFGISTGAGGATFSGFISNVRIYKGATGSAPYAATSTTITVPTQPLAAITNTSLMTCQSNRFIDNSTNNFTITRNGDTRVQTQNPFQNNSGQSYNFDGTGDYLTAPASPSLDFGTGDFTIETWVNFTALSSNRVLLDRWVTGNANSWQLYWRSIGTSMTFLTGSSTVLVQDPNGSNITAGTWNHIAVTRSGIAVRLFVNGIVVATNTSSLSLSNTLPLGVGVQTSTITNFLNGYLSDTRITKGVARYTANFTPPTEPFQDK